MWKSPGGADQIDFNDVRVNKLANDDSFMPSLQMTTFVHFVVKGLYKYENHCSSRENVL